jgi:hypothetical protein
MLKQSITYTDYNEKERTEDFYFNFTKLELMETDLKWGGFEQVVEELTRTTDAQKAYGLFKEIILASYGVKSDDGRRFIKNEQLTKDFEQNPACSELIISFLQNPGLASQFVQGVLPAKLVAEVQAAKGEDSAQLPLWQQEHRAPTRQEIQSMSKDELAAAMRAKTTIRPVEEVPLPEPDIAVDPETEELRRQLLGGDET